jgi:hypothetical protein
MLLLAWIASASALTDDRYGLTVDLGGGIGWEAARTAGLARAATSYWWGRYDEEYALGRYFALGADLTAGFASGAPSGRGLIQVRRGVDLLVVGWHLGLGAGPALASSGTLGGAARAELGVRLRRSRTVAFALRLDAGADWLDGAVHPAGGATLGLSLGGPTDGGNP